MLHIYLIYYYINRTQITYHIPAHIKHYQYHLFLYCAYEGIRGIRRTRIITHYTYSYISLYELCITILPYVMHIIIIAYRLQSRELNVIKFMMHFRSDNLLRRLKDIINYVSATHH